MIYENLHALTGPTVTAGQLSWFALPQADVGNYAHGRIVIDSSTIREYEPVLGVNAGRATCPTHIDTCLSVALLPSSRPLEAIFLVL